MRWQGLAPVRHALQLGAQGVRDKTARACAAHDEAIAVQLHIGVLHRIACHAQRLRQRAAGGQLDAGAQRAFQHQSAQRPLNALVQVQRRQLGLVQAHF